MNPRLTAYCDLQVATVREWGGRHEYDGVVQDLSPGGVSAGLARLGDGPDESDPYEEAALRAGESGLQAAFGLVEEHRRNPMYHIMNLDVACYDREYAPLSERSEARRRHLAAWSEAVDASTESLDRVPPSLAEELIPVARGLTFGVDDDAAIAAIDRLVAHLEGQAAGDAEETIGTPALAALLGQPEAMAVDVAALAKRADAERERLRARLIEDCARLRPGADPAALVAELSADHPVTPDEIYAEARGQIQEATAFVLDHDLLPDPGGECLVGPAPPARRAAMAMMSWAAPYEADAPSWYYVTPPEPSWAPQEQEDWLEIFSRTTLPAITVHEVMPGHFAHGRFLRRLSTDVRRTTMSLAFIEGWAHYAEEMMVEEGFRGDDPRYAIGVWKEALIRVTRLAVSIGIHTGTMSLDEAALRFQDDAFLQGKGARSEAARAIWDPAYGRYTWGKLEILALRDQARNAWGAGYSHRRFHEALLALGAPPLGLIDRAL